MPHPWLSILIPVYNVEPYVEACLESICSQLQPGIEIIALDDCSTDSSLAVVKKFQEARNAPIKIMQHETNRGLSAARNTMLEVAQGEYLWFVDSDDALAEGAISRLYEIVTRHQPDLILCDFYNWRETPRKGRRGRKDRQRKTFSGPANILLTNSDDLLGGVYFCGELHIWSKISKRKLWGDDLRFPEGKLLEDMVTTPRLLLKANNYFYAPEVWVSYRQRPGSILSTPSLKKIWDAGHASDGTLEFLQNALPSISTRTEFAFTYFCARTYIGISRDLITAKPTLTNYTEARAYHRDLFLKNTNFNRKRVFLEYLKRGWLLRLKRLFKYLS